MSVADPQRPTLDQLRTELDRSAEDMAEGRTAHIEDVVAAIKRRTAYRRLTTGSLTVA